MDKLLTGSLNLSLINNKFWFVYDWNTFCYNKFLSLHYFAIESFYKVSRTINTICFWWIYVTTLLETDPYFCSGEFFHSDTGIAQNMQDT